MFGVINRFSEDIDLSLAPAFLGLDEPDANATSSKGQANRWMERAEATCTAVVRDKLAPEIATAVGASLGKSGGPWLTFEVDANSHSPVLLFHYPATQPPALEYRCSTCSGVTSGRCLVPRRARVPGRAAAL